MRLNQPYERQLVAGRDYPNIEGKVKITLHNCKNHKDEFVYESKNMITNALKDIFATNPGGLVGYQNFASLYTTWLGGVLVFGNQLNLSSADDYFIPASADNPVRAHAGQTSLTDQADDITRGNPNSLGTVTSVGSTKLVFEWGTSAGNGVISSLGLTHTDTGSLGTGIVSNAQRTFYPFAEVGNSTRSYSYGDTAASVMAINGNTAYTFYLKSTTSVDIFITPINNNKFKLQGGSLDPLQDKDGVYYSTKITATLPNAYISAPGGCYYDWDFTNNTLTLWSVAGLSQSTLYQDIISLSDGTVTHSSIPVTGATLWSFHTSTTSGWGRGAQLQMPVPAMIAGGYIYLWNDVQNGGNNYIHPMEMVRLNLSTTSDIQTVDMTAVPGWPDGDNTGIFNNRSTTIGDIIVHDSFIINSNKFYPLTWSKRYYQNSYVVTEKNKLCTATCGLNVTQNIVSVCKLYLATKYNLPAPVTKTNAQSMTVEYTLTEV